MVERRRELDFKDSYTYRNVLSQLDHQIKTFLPVLRDYESIFPGDRKEVYQTIKNLFDSGRWNNDFYQLKDDVTKCFEMNFTCEFCGIYRAIEPKCNKCDREF